MRLPSLDLHCPECCGWLLLGYVFGHCVKGSGGGRNCGDLKRCANLDSNDSPPELELEALS
jgi:hypothetical protein